MGRLSRKDYPETPDGRYFVSKGRLWRKTDPRLSDSDRRAAIKRLMQARRDGKSGLGQDWTFFGLGRRLGYPPAQIASR